LGDPWQSAIWIPPGVPHSCGGSGSIESYCLFVEQQRAVAMPRVCCLIGVCPLFEELLRRAARQPVATNDSGPETRRADLIIDELTTAPIQHMSLPMPTDPRLRRIAEALISDPSDKATVTQWASRVGFGERTLCRLLHQETGMSFGRWRRQLHVFVGLRRLGAGQTVETVAIDLGYESASGFTAMFRKTVGKPPALSRRSLRHRRDRGLIIARILEPGTSDTRPAVRAEVHIRTVHRRCRAVYANRLIANIRCALGDRKLPSPLGGDLFSDPIAVATGQIGGPKPDAGPALQSQRMRKLSKRGRCASGGALVNDAPPIRRWQLPTIVRLGMRTRPESLNARSKPLRRTLRCDRVPL
jgi:AraC family transcriptional regulator, regulator of nimT